VSKQLPTEAINAMVFWKAKMTGLVYTKVWIVTPTFMLEKFK